MTPHLEYPHLRLIAGADHDDGITSVRLYADTTTEPLAVLAVLVGAANQILTGKPQ